MPTAGLHGVIPIVPTPFDDDGQVDHAGLGRIVDYLVRVGVHGVAVLGMASEAYALTDAERERVIATAAERLAGRLPLVAGCSHNSGVAVAQLAAVAQQAGADALMIMPPAMGDPTPSVIRDYFAEAAAATGLPIMVQDNPGWTGVQLPISLYEELCALDTVRYAKIETRHPPTTISDVRALVGDRLAILGGQAGNWLPEELARGTVGTMPAAIMPQAYLKIWALWSAGRREEARGVFEHYHPLIRVSGVPGVGIPMSKVLYARLGLIRSSAVRAPLSPLRNQDYVDLDTILSDLDVINVMNGTTPASDGVRPAACATPAGPGVSSSVR